MQISFKVKGNLTVLTVDSFFSAPSHTQKILRFLKILIKLIKLYNN